MATSDVNAIGYDVALVGFDWKQGVVYDGMAAGSRNINAPIWCFRLYSNEIPVQYRSCLVGSPGWTDWAYGGGYSGSYGTPLEAIQLQLIGGNPGEAAQQPVDPGAGPGQDIYYRAFMGVWWMGAGRFSTTSDGLPWHSLIAGS